MSVAFVGIESLDVQEQVGGSHEVGVLLGIILAMSRSPFCQR